MRRNGPTRGPDNYKDIWILGAGFSKQINDDMPLTPELAESVRDIISDRFDNPLILSDIELALSELQSDAPWKSPAEKYEDLALYERVIERIRDQLKWPNGEGQDWPGDTSLGKRLVNTWHINGNHVLTFNYDLLVEALAETVHCSIYRDSDDSNNDRYLYPRHIYPIPIPHVRTRNGGTWRGNTDEITFNYYKLHGSLNYYTYPHPFQNMNMYHKHHNEVEELAEGLKTFIVPPTNDKQVFTEHPILQAIWTKAAGELANCNCGRIIMAGYSMPKTDLTVLSMLRETIRSNSINGRLFPEIIVVNPDPDAALHIKGLLGIGNPFGQVTDVAGFLEQYAPSEFVRTHVWDNRHIEDVMEADRIYREAERVGKSPKDASKLIFKFNDELREQGRLGQGWFISNEEHRGWIKSIHDIPVNWL